MTDPRLDRIASLLTLKADGMYGLSAINQRQHALQGRRPCTGSSTQSIVRSVPITSTSAPPTTKPAVVPSTPRSAVCPVVSAFERSTDRVPRTIQNECWTPETSATS